MKTLVNALDGATVVAVRTSTGLVARGGPGVSTWGAGNWELIIDDFGRGSVSPARMQRVLLEAERDPIGCVLRHFDSASRELFALVGPPGVIAGAGPLVPRGSQLAVMVRPDEGLIALGFASITRSFEDGWLCFAPGCAVCWGPKGPEVFCDLVRGTTWVAR